MNEKDEMTLNDAVKLLNVSKEYFVTRHEKAIDTVLQALKDKDNKIKELEADLYSANCTINDYIEERNKLKDKMIGDKMEQFDDYVIYLIESYLEIMGE